MYSDYYFRIDYEGRPCMKFWHTIRVIAYRHYMDGRIVHGFKLEIDPLNGMECWYFMMKARRGC